MKSLLAFVVALLSGILFGAGFFLSGMADPAKVIGFLDLTGLFDGRWDPSLMLVMAGALAVYLPGFHFLVKPRLAAQAAPLAAQSYHLPRRTRIDRRLLSGSALFGLGWGIAGICPGPALANLGSGSLSVLLFVAAMLVGIKTGCALKPREATPESVQAN
ncbi:YeeE/YedE family protein [Ferrimonas gelatinilytica]|uniref:YeeE/YedE family protein n=1 Tax=Ferrimonas gelatinilytica TaxID=1255257 RepID=A0ABP9RUX4_9GAMM